MPCPRLAAAALVALIAVAHSSCAAQYGTRETFAAGQGDVEAQLRAAEDELQRGHAANAAEALDALTVAPLEPRQQQRFQLLSAEVALAQDEPLRALQALPPASALQDTALAARGEATRARALFRIGDAVGAVQTLVQRERVLTDDAAREASRELLWHELQTAALDSATSARLAQTDRVSRGWIALAIIARSVWPQPQELQKRVAEWQAAYPQHPGAARLAAVQTAPPPPRRELGHVALLLPLSGAFAATGEAVRDGFFSAWYAAPDPKPAARVYDTGASPDTAMAAWRQALDQGAEFVVGPLRREDVAQLAGDGRPGVPVLALNYLDAGRSAPFNFYQWGLAPEDEARQAAERAIADRQRRAVILAPEGEWGDRIVRAFTGRLQELGGTVVAARSYAPASRDHSEEIKALFALDSSAERHRALQSTLGESSEFEPRRRDDVDLVFVVARPDQAKLIGPELRFHRSGSLPIYTTAAIYDGEVPDPDLSGLRFCDMPWMLSDAPPWGAARTQLKALFPARGKEYTRLMALGYDAFALVGLIDSGQMRPGSFFPAASGTLTLREGGTISRGLSCAEVRAGSVRPLDTLRTAANAR